MEFGHRHPDGSEQILATSAENVSVTVTATGAYRAEVYIVPKHLRPFLGPFAKRADVPYLWVVTNHMYLAP